MMHSGCAGYRNASSPVSNTPGHDEHRHRGVAQDLGSAGAEEHARERPDGAGADDQHVPLVNRQVSPRYLQGSTGTVAGWSGQRVVVLLDEPIGPLHQR